MKFFNEKSNLPLKVICTGCYRPMTYVFKKDGKSLFCSERCYWLYRDRVAVEKRGL